MTRRTTAGAGAGAAAEEAVTWDVYRRYSDFYELHQIIQDKVSANVSYAVVDYMMIDVVNLSLVKIIILLIISSLNNMSFAWVFRQTVSKHVVFCFLQFEGISACLVLPSKKAFNNMTKEFLEKRKTGLNAYLQVDFVGYCITFSFRTCASTYNVHVQSCTVMYSHVQSCTVMYMYELLREIPFSC